MRSARVALVMIVLAFGSAGLGFALLSDAPTAGGWPTGTRASFGFGALLLAPLSFVLGLVVAGMAMFGVGEPE